MWYLFEENPTDVGRFCIECGEFSEWDNFYTAPRNRNGRMVQCKRCNIDHVRWRSRFKRLNPPPAACQHCNVVGRVEVDHDHDTMTFRAWLCRSCNLRARRF